MESQIKLLDVVALTEEIPGSRLPCGQVGTVVEILDASVFEIDFNDNEGRTFACL